MHPKEVCSNWARIKGIWTYLFPHFLPIMMSLLRSQPKLPTIPTGISPWPVAIVAPSWILYQVVFVAWLLSGFGVPALSGWFAGGFWESLKGVGIFDPTWIWNWINLSFWCLPFIFPVSAVLWWKGTGAAFPLKLVLPLLAPFQNASLWPRGDGGAMGICLWTAQGRDIYIAKSTINQSYKSCSPTHKPSWETSPEGVCQSSSHEEGTGCTSQVGTTHRTLAKPSALVALLAHRVPARHEGHEMIIFMTNGARAHKTLWIRISRSWFNLRVFRFWFHLPRSFHAKTEHVPPELERNCIKIFKAKLT